jgi:hypothetical protein
VAIALLVVALQPARILAAKDRPGQNGRFAAFGPGGGLEPPVRPYLVRATPWAYDGVPGEGSIPVPLPPPNSPSRRILRTNSFAIKPSNSAGFSFEHGLPIGRVGLLFSERPASLRSSGLHRFDTVLEIPTFRATYEPREKRFCGFSWATEISDGVSGACSRSCLT